MTVFWRSHRDFDWLQVNGPKRIYFSGDSGVLVQPDRKFLMQAFTTYGS